MISVIPPNSARYLCIHFSILFLIFSPGPGFTKGLKQKNVITLGEKS